MVGAIAVVALIALVVFRPGCIFASAKKPVVGTFMSKHLHLAWEFPIEWSYAEDRDASEKTPSGWNRRSSVFFHGANANAFQSQIVVIEFDRSDKAATDEDARQLGANETLGTSFRRRCETTEIRAGIDGTRCFALAARPGQPLAVYEIYFALEGRAVFVRFSYELPGFGQIAGSPEDQERQSRLAEEQLADQVESAQKILESMRVAP